jgi:hypothetical protein
MNGKIIIRNYWPLSVITTVWFMTFFTLSSNFLKFNTGVIALSPMVIVPLLGWMIFPSIRKPFLNAHMHDRNFIYVAIAVFSFTFLMAIQTILSDWLMRAISELLKTFLFFFLTHTFFSMLTNTKNIKSAVRLSLLISGIFLTYLAYLYLFKFGASFISINPSEANTDGRNTLALYIFICIVMVTNLIKEDRGINAKLLNYFLLFLFLLVGLLSGSRSGIIFPIIFLVFTFVWQLFLPHKNKVLYRVSVFVCFVIIVLILIIEFTKSTSIPLYLISDLLWGNKSSGDGKRLTLIKVGFDCFSSNNILFGHGVKNYLSCVERSSIGSDLILHNEYLSLLNNVGVLGCSLWIFIISAYSKIFSFSRKNYIYRIGVLVYLSSLFVIDGYNSPMFGVLLAFSRHEWNCERKVFNLQN